MTNYQKIIIFLFVAAVLSGCGTTSSFRGTRLASAGGFDATLGFSVHGLMIQEPYYPEYDKDLQHETTRFIHIKPELSLSRRLGSENSRWDVGINSAFIPFPMNSYVIRRNLIQEKSYGPITTIGFMYRQVLFDEFNAEDIWPFPSRGYSDSEQLQHRYDYYEFVDMGIPLYMSWVSHYEQVDDINLMVMPFGRAMDADDQFPSRLGLQLNIGVTLGWFVPEISLIYSRDDSLQAQFGLAMKLF